MDDRHGPPMVWPGATHSMARPRLEKEAAHPWTSARPEGAPTARTEPAAGTTANAISASRSQQIMGPTAPVFGSHAGVAFDLPQPNGELSGCIVLLTCSDQSVLWQRRAIVPLFLHLLAGSEPSMVRLSHRIKAGKSCGHCHSPR
jgi:hypothetical protein